LGGAFVLVLVFVVLAVHSEPGAVHTCADLGWNQFALREYMWLLLAAASFHGGPVRSARHRSRRIAAEETNSAFGEDWREVRARLVQKEQKDQARSDEQPAMPVFETPLIEVGSLLLDAMPGAHSAEQPFFHKAAMVVIEHKQHEFTFGLLLNRPSGCVLDGWRLRYGGPVGEGGLFHRYESDRIYDSPATPRALLCLHLLDDAHPASRCSFPVLPGVSFTTFEHARALVEAGEARKTDFVLYVGYCGWGADQLQGEYDRGDWAIVSSPSELLRELIEESRAGPLSLSGHEDSPLSAPLDDGMARWETLMRCIGRKQTVAQAKRSLADDHLRVWIRTHLEAPSAPD
jgi:putative AlgH/UPF0301 family transcriptional regulator